MEKIKKSSTKNTDFIHIVYDDEPNIKTHAASILLWKKLYQLDEDYISKFELIKKRIDFSRTYLNNQKISGELVCHYCYKKDLIIEEEGMKVPTKIKATIDHIIPISRGGNVFDTENIVVCCGVCNTKKGNMDYINFKR